MACNKSNRNLKTIGEPTKIEKIIQGEEYTDYYYWADGRIIIVNGDEDGRDYAGRILAMDGFVPTKDNPDPEVDIIGDGKYSRININLVYLGEGSGICSLAVASVLKAVLLSMNKRDKYAPDGNVHISSEVPCAAFNCYNRAFLMNGFKLKDGEFERFHDKFKPHKISITLQFESEEQRIKQQCEDKCEEALKKVEPLTPNSLKF